MINIAIATLLFVLGALGGALACLLRLYRQRPRCQACGEVLPPELQGAVCCWACIAAVMSAQTLPDWRSLTPDADRLLRAYDDKPAPPVGPGETTK